MRGLGARLGPSALARIHEAGLDLSQPLAGSYPREVVLGAVEAAAAALHPDVEPSEAHRLLGFELVRGFTGTWKAKAALATARAMGAERTLVRLLGHHRTPSDFLELDFRQEGPGAYALELNLGTRHPEVLQGLAEAVLEALGARGAEVRLAARGVKERLEVRLPRR